MDIEILINNIMQSFLLPPGISLLLIIIGLFLIRFFYTAGKSCLILGFFSLFIFSLPITAQALNLILEKDKALTSSQLKQSKAGAIVVLGAGRYKNSIEYASHIDTISNNALERLRYGVYIHKQNPLPLLLSGGNPGGEIQTEAAIMKTALKDIFKLKAKWLDTASSNTWNNARFSAKILKQNNIDTIFLVTHADHIPRAKMSFEHFGIKVIAAPLGFKAQNRINQPYTIRDFLPSAYAIQLCSSAIHEFIGYAWYTIRYKWLDNETVI